MAVNAFIAYAKKLINFVYPPLCPGCLSEVDGDYMLCHKCWSNIDFLTGQCCPVCALPHTLSFESPQPCLSCIDKKRSFSASVAVVAYKDKVKHLVKQFKQHKRFDIGVYMAHNMARKAESLIEQADFLVPVPMHLQKLRRKGFNHALTLTKILAEENKKNVLDCLLKTNSGVSQASLEIKAQRISNAKNSFTYHERFKGQILNKNLLLIDDVMTTGATLEACAKALKKVGAKKVNTLVFARTPLLV